MYNSPVGTVVRGGMYGQGGTYQGVPGGIYTRVYIYPPHTQGGIYTTVLTVLGGWEALRAEVLSLLLRRLGSSPRRGFSPS